MTDNDDLVAQVRKQDEEAELQVAAQLSELHPATEATGDEDSPAKARRPDEEPAGQAAELGKDTEATGDDDSPAGVRRQDEEAELQVAAQLSELREDDHT